jgi:hypothetical protein
VSASSCCINHPGLINTLPRLTCSWSVLVVSLNRFSEHAGSAAGGGPAGGGSVVLPAPAKPARPSGPRSTAANPRAVISTENIHEDILSYHQSRPRRLDLFEDSDSDSDSDSDDDVPALAEPVDPPALAVHVPPILAPLIVAPVPHVPVFVPVAPVIDVPVEPFT